MYQKKWALYIYIEEQEKKQLIKCKYLKVQSKDLDQNEDENMAKQVERVLYTL